MTVILIDFIFLKKKNYLQVFLKEYEKIEKKKKNVIRHIIDNLEIFSDDSDESDESQWFWWIW